MVAPGGIAPPPSESKSEALLLSYGAKESGLTNGIRTRTAAVTGRDAAVTSWSTSGKWWLCPVARRSLLVFSEALICLSYTAWGAPGSGGGNGASGRNCTCVRPLRSRMPYLLSHGSPEIGRAPRCCSGCLLVPSQADYCLPRARWFDSVWLVKWLRRPDSNRRYAAYETAALPLGYSAVDGVNGWMMARRPGAAPDRRSFGDSAAQAGARRFLFLGNGAASRNRTGISCLEAKRPALGRWPHENESLATQTNLSG